MSSGLALETLDDTVHVFPRPFAEKQLLMFSVPAVPPQEKNTSPEAETAPPAPQPSLLTKEDEIVVNAFEAMLRVLGEREMVQGAMLTSSKTTFANSLAKIALILESRRPKLPYPDDPAEVALIEPETSAERAKRLAGEEQAWLGNQAVNELMMIGQAFWSSAEQDDGGFTFMEEFGKAQERLSADPKVRKILKGEAVSLTPTTEDKPQAGTALVPAKVNEA